jgi:beta-fructofuranosidase
MKNASIIILMAILLVACSESKQPDSAKPVAVVPAPEWSLRTKQPTEDYTSKVPKFTFATTLEEQEEELKTNPLMLRFEESRRKLAEDPHVPLYHFTAPENRLNDPNGLSFWQGRWHLFYQGYPTEDPRQHWGHAVSTDLIHWRDLPYAIYPNPEHACFSGSTLVEDDRVIAMYHGTRVGNMVAVSDDPLLLNWEKVTGKPVIPVAQSGETLPYNVFDPCIWKKDGMYYALSGGRKQERPGGKPIRANYLFRSKDLASWEYLHPFVEDDVFTMVWDDGGCPYFWPIGEKHILPFFSHTSGGQYLLGDYDTQRDKFVATAHGLFNFGAWGPGGIHAPSAVPDGKGGVIIIFNMNPAKPTEGWDQIMSLPRRLTLLSEDMIGMEPAGDIESLRYDHQHVAAMTLPANQEVVLDNITGNAMEILVEIDPKDAPTVEMNVFRSPDLQEYTRISFFKNRGYRDWGRYDGWDQTQRLQAKASLISIESAHSSILPDVKSRAPETAPFHLEPGETLKLRVFLDKSVVEVFVNGKQCVAMRVYPGLKESVGVSFRSQGQDSELVALHAYRMKSIYDD